MASTCLLPAWHDDVMPPCSPWHIQGTPSSHHPMAIGEKLEHVQESRDGNATKKPPTQFAQTVWVNSSCLLSPDPPILAFFFFSICFFRFPIFLAFFLARLPSFSKDFRGSAKRKTLAFLSSNPCFFPIQSKGWRVRSAYLKRERGDNLYKSFQNRLRKLCLYLGGIFWGWVSPRCGNSATEFLAIPGPRFWESCGSRFAILCHQDCDLKKLRLDPSTSVFTFNKSQGPHGARISRQLSESQDSWSAANGGLRGGGLPLTQKAKRSETIWFPNEFPWKLRKWKRKWNSGRRSINTKATAKSYFQGINFTLISNLRVSEEKGPFPLFSGFPRCSSHPPEKGDKGRKWARKADFSRFPGRAARHPLSPHLLHPHLRQPKILKTQRAQRGISMPWGTNRRETIFVAQLNCREIRVILKEEVKPSLFRKHNRSPHKRLSKMISLNAKNLENVLLPEPQVAVMFSCRTLTRSAKVSCCPNCRA